MSEPKILLLDIEWKPTLAYVWRPYDETIIPEKIVEHGGLLCVGYKWLGEDTTYVACEWDRGHTAMLRRIHKAMTRADAIVTYNGDKYDLKKLAGEFLLYGLPPAPPVASIDVLKAVKKFGYFMNRLAFIGPFLGLEGKVEHEGMALWTKVINKDPDARRRMSEYCERDVTLLEELYVKVRPHITNHPHLGNRGPRQCSACGSKNVQFRGTRRTRSFKIQRLHCQDCGSWQSGTRSKV